ncbi:MAG: EutN/CcmL family microcompartment protein [Bacillota bacterium]
MIIAKVTGAVVSTIKDRRLSGYKLAIVQEYSPEKKKVRGEPFVAVDIFGSGLGSLVCVTTGSPAQLVLSSGEPVGTTLPQEKALPVDAAIVAIIDEIDFARC